MVFRTWDFNFRAWKILGYGFQDMVFRTWDFNFGAWIFTLVVSKTETWKFLGRDFQDVGFQFWDLDFTQRASHDPGLGIFLAHDFQNMDGEPSNFIVSKSHGHPLVCNNNNKNSP
jgi:hypothetical protein